jgi:hypothetical protein
MDTGIYKDVVKYEGEISFFKPDFTLKFYKDYGNKEIGCLDFNCDKLKFEGDMEESAKIFMEYLLKSFNNKIEEIKSEAWNNGYDEGKED